MSEPSDQNNIWLLRQKIIGLGERSISKSYYPELRRKLDQLEAQNSDLEEKTRALKKLMEALEEERRKTAASEVNYRSVVENIQDIFYRSDIQGNLIMASPSLLILLGYDSLENCLGRPIAETFYYDPKKRTEFLKQVQEAGNVTNYEVMLKKSDGTPVPVETNSHLYYDSSGVVAGVEGVFRDITERKKAEDELLESRNYLDEIINSVADPIFVKDRQHRWVLLNDAYCSFMGYTREELIDKSDYDFFTASEADVFWAKDEIVFTSGMENINEEHLTDANGIVHIIVTKKTLYTNAKGEQFIVGIIRDITEFKRAEEAWRKSEEKFRTLVDNLNVGVYRNTGDFPGRFIQANPAMVKMFGYNSSEEFMNIAVSDLYQNPQERRLLIEEVRQFGHVKDRELALRKKDGSPIWASISATAQRDEKGEIKWMDGVVEDITERKKTEVALRESEQRLKTILHGSPIATFVINKDHRVIHWNDALEQLSGIKSGTILDTKDQWKAFYDKERPCLADLIVDGSLEAIPEWYSGKYTESKLINEAYEATDFFPYLGDTGKWLRFTAAAIKNAEGDLIGAIETLEDISDRIHADEKRKLLESQLAQAQKMEAIGTLAGGIAHDFNNILSAIIGYTQLAMVDLQEKELAENELNEVLKAGERAKNLVSHILTFSRKTETMYSPLELPSIVKESIKMLRSVIPSTIEIKQDIIKSGLVMSDPTQIHQIIMNLCTNAGHAMDETGGVLDVCLRKENIHGDALTRDLDLTPGHYFRLTISDTGHGMTPEVKEKIFDPYFTTKEKGRGTGLGLAVVHGIVKNHLGAITCKSDPGKGTTFDIYLPELESGKEAFKSLDDELIPKGDERILFIDDEPVLTNMAKKMLGDLGYEVVIETSSLEALEIFKKSPYRFDLVITDMTMPGMTGDRLAQNLISIRRDIPVILCTGYSEHITGDRAKSIGIREFIMKPLELKSLAQVIRKALDIR